MEVTQLKEIVPDNLLSAKFNGQELDEFHRLMKQWTDPEYLFDFFTKDSEVLFGGFYKNTESIEDAVNVTLEDANEFYDMMLDCGSEGSAKLGELFKPLHAKSTSLLREESKARGPLIHSWLRLYAIRIARNYYAIASGGIKLTKTMQEGANFEEHFVKLKVVASFLRDNDLQEPDDYAYLDIDFL